MIKFKYLAHSRRIDIEEMEEDFALFPAPLPYKNLPDGEYMIRGNKKGQRKEYWKVAGLWFLIHDVKKDNGHYGCDATKYMLFPSLPEKEWKLMKSIPYERLTRIWQRWIFAHEHWLELRKITIGVRKSFLEFQKQYNESSN